MCAASIEFVVPGTVVPWARTAGGKNGHRFTPGKQARYMTALKLICQAATKGAKPLEGPIALEVMATYAWPKSLSAKKRALPGAAWRTGRPDADNIAKIIGDALNNIAWLDDAQISVASIRKTYSDHPGLTIKIEALA
jgi:Holliday junction resolvase RusA-like endonuclease